MKPRWMILVVCLLAAIVVGILIPSVILPKMAVKRFYGLAYNHFP